MADINPRIDENGGPVCSGEECPAYMSCSDDGCPCGITTRHGFCQYNAIGAKPLVFDSEPRSDCVPGLRRLLAERTEERDDARRELCDELASWSQEFPVSGNPEDYAAERGWSYLYPPTQGGEKGGGE